MLGRWFSLNGSLLPIEKAVIPLDNLEFSYGFGVYETLKVRSGHLYFPERHMERLFHSAKTIGLNVPLPSDALFSALKDLVRALNDELLQSTPPRDQSYNLKILCVAGTVSIFATAPLYVPEKYYKHGVDVITHHGERLFPQAKTLNMFMSYLAYARAKEASAYDALLVDREGVIREGTRTNLFFTDGISLFTPPREHVLEGVTKLTLTDALREKGVTVTERPLSVQDIPTYAGFFLTSTSSKVLPISQIDHVPIQIPTLVREVMRIYDQYLEKYASRVIERRSR
ncbi:aminotransferase class IV family protein [Candidatus Woesearchaeota archaeon]|nr:aminotransferase class IV family protein [Candidatus Woesearchaeota archaeon]